MWCGKYIGLTRAAVSMAPSTSLFLFQRAYVLRIKKPELIELGGSGVTGDVRDTFGANNRYQADSCERT